MEYILMNSKYYSRKSMIEDGNKICDVLESCMY